ELMAALADLEKAGIDHRDIKPANLGIGADSRKTQRLKLFDFSLSRAPANAVEAGTPPYLDPFLGGDRGLYDSAAERYSAAVVLYEMASGQLPRYGEDARAHPASVPDDVTVPKNAFDPALQDGLAEFFRIALARDARKRFGTVADMRREWNRIVGGVSTEVTQQADDLAADVTLDTPLVETGLTARALSGLEVFQIATVREFLSLDPVLLNRMSGTTAITREEVKKRRREWHSRLGSDLVEPSVVDGALTLESIRDTLLDAIAEQAKEARGELAGLILGTSARKGRSRVDAFSSQTLLGGLMSKVMAPAGVNQLLQTFHEEWAEDMASRRVLSSLDKVVDAAMREAGGVAAPAELAARLLAAFTPSGRPGGIREQQSRSRLALGLLRIITDRRRYLLRAESSELPLEVRRHDERVVTVGRSAGLLDAADALARAAEQAIEPLGATVLSAERSRLSMEPVLERFAGQIDPVDPKGTRMAEGMRPVRLAAAVSVRAAATSAGELYRGDLAVAEMVRLAVGDVGVTERLSPAALQDRVRSRFPASVALPSRPQLDRVVTEAGLDLRFDDAAGQYVHPTQHSSSTAITTRRGTQLAQDMDVVEDSAITRRLAESVRQRSYLVLGTEPSRLSRLGVALENRFGSTVLDVTGLLLDELRILAEQDTRVPSWDQLMAADAEAEGSRARQGLAVVVGMAMPAIEAHLLSVLNPDDGDQGERGPLVLRDVSPLIRYGHVSVLRQLSDLTVARGRAVWVLAPQFGIYRGAEVDGVSLATSPNQFLDIDYAWTDAQSVVDVTDEIEMKDHA
ncbi:MAG: protein kinase domain-containing protein, partial [Candidatus Corynebacterium faecigallinarum]